MNTKSTSKAAMVLLTLSLGARAGAAETLRCGASLIDPGMPMAEVEAKCGAPDRREVERVPIRGRSAGGGSIVIGETTVEHWLYERYGRFPARLTFEDGRLERIEFLTDQFGLFMNESTAVVTGASRAPSLVGARRDEGAWWAHATDEQRGPGAPDALRQCRFGCYRARVRHAAPDSRTMSTIARIET